MHIDKDYGPLTQTPQSLPDRWILSRINQVTITVEEALDAYKFNEAASAIYRFIWHEFCDWYLETVKPALYDQEEDAKKEETKKVLWIVLKETLVLLHPIAPIVTEEIWQKLPGTKGSIMKAKFPTRDVNPANDATNSEAVSQMNLIIEIITAVRNIRGEMNIPPSTALDLFLCTPDPKNKTICDQQAKIITNLARLNTLNIRKEAKRPKVSATAIVNNITVYIDLEGIIDVFQERARLEKEIAKLNKEMSSVSNKLSNEDFLSKAPPQIISKVRNQHEEFLEKQQKLTTTLERIKAIEL
jgi:valyl-tRNA synthetase